MLLARFQFIRRGQAPRRASAELTVAQEVVSAVAYFARPKRLT